MGRETELLLEEVNKRLDLLISSSGGSVAESNLNKLKSQADDLKETYSYLDPTDLVNRRISTIVYSSITLCITVTETFTYAGSVGDYYVTQSILS